MAAETREVVMEWRGKQIDILTDPTRELCVEGAIRAGKTTACLWKEFNAYVAHPGMFGLLARWTDSGVYGLLVPLWREICARAGVRLKWHADEEYDELPNGSRAYIRGLKTQDATMRYGKFRGLTLSRVFVDQAEEIPQDVYLELAGRLSQKGYPHQIVIAPQAVDENHWIAHEFPADNTKPERRHVPLSVYDNAHNLDPSVVPALLRIYPPEHPKHKTLILGQRGMNVTGVPVYRGAFYRPRHEVPVPFDPALPLLLGLDFGKHHPCIVARQDSPFGQRRYIGGVMGQDLYLGTFLDVALRYLGEWFPNPVSTRWCCDPAGASDTSHGTEGAVKMLNARGIYPLYELNANSPAVRLAMVEQMAERMRKRDATGGEALAVHNGPTWKRVSAQAAVDDRFLADGFEAGYVWDEHLVSVGNKQVRKPKKDGWFEHGMNVAEYLEVNFGVVKPKAAPVASSAAPARPSAWG